MQPTDVAKLGLESTISVELESFWASGHHQVSYKYKYELQTISWQYFINKPSESAKDIILSGYLTNADGGLM